MRCACRALMKSVWGRTFNSAGSGRYAANKRSDGTTTDHYANVPTALQSGVDVIADVFSPGKGSDVLDLVRGRSGKSTMVAMHWETGGHMVVVEKVEAGRVYFRNPWGGRDAGERSDPPRRIEPGRTGIESMTEAEFTKRAEGAVY